MAHGYNEAFPVEKNTAMALYAIANELRGLGTGGAVSDMGALEFLAVTIKEGIAEMTSALADLVTAIGEQT